MKLCLLTLCCFFPAIMLFSQDINPVTDKEVKKYDSISVIMKEFERFKAGLKMCTSDALIDTAATYKLKYIYVENSVSRFGHQFPQIVKILMINNAEKDRAIKFNTLNFISRYSESCIVKQGLPIVETGNTYNSLRQSMYYYEKVAE